MNHGIQRGVSSSPTILIIYFLIFLHPLAAFKMLGKINILKDLSFCEGEKLWLPPSSTTQLYFFRRKIPLAKVRFDVTIHKYFIKERKLRLHLSRIVFCFCAHSQAFSISQTQVVVSASKKWGRNGNRIKASLPSKNHLKRKMRKSFHARFEYQNGEDWAHLSAINGLKLFPFHPFSLARSLSFLLTSSTLCSTRSFTKNRKNFYNTNDPTAIRPDLIYILLSSSVSPL